MEQNNPFKKQEDTAIPQKQKTAIALSYDPDDAAPKVIATGKGYLADKIIQKAKEADIPL